jgi:ribosome biogenesis protein UTP30
MSLSLSLSHTQLSQYLKVLPLKQLKLEFRPFESKRKLCSNYDLFICDEKLHAILKHGSKLGKEFRKKKK